MNQQLVYIITESDDNDNTTDIVSVHGTPARALIEMKRIASADGNYRQRQSEREEFPWWKSPTMTLEIDVRVVH